MRVAIVQSCYLPWKGYFDLMQSVDHFILLDDVQYTRRDWRNRNQIKTMNGLRWLTIPLKNSGNYQAKISDMQISDLNWRLRHFSIIEQVYRGSPGWETLKIWLNECLLTTTSLYLTEVNEKLIRSLCFLLGINTSISRSANHSIQFDSPTDRLVKLCNAVGATCYISGPSARAYLDTMLFRESGIELEFFEYGGYAEYDQPHGPFVHNVSIIDALACLGKEVHKALRRTTNFGI